MRLARTPWTLGPLLLLVTVGLGGCVEVGDIRQRDTAPSVNTVKEEASDRLTIQSVTGDADWRSLALRTSTTGLRFALNDQPTPGATTLAGHTWTPVTSTSQRAHAGDFLAICATGGPRNDATIEMKHVGTDTGLGSFGFLTIESC